MVSKEQIQRLGFDAWAKNVAADAIEAYVFPGCGNASMESKDFSYNIRWDDDNIAFSLRVYTSEGWKEYSTELKR